MSTWAAEFDFVEDESGEGKFVNASNVTGQLQTLIGRGEVDLAARIYEENGGSAAESLVAEAKLASSNTRRMLGEMFRKARDFGNAARVFELNGQFEETAELYERSGAFAEAGAAFQRAGNLAKAAAAFDRAGKTAEAIELYRKADDRESLADCLARAGRYADAAEVFRALRNVRAEVEMLRAVPATDPRRVESVKRQVQLLEHYGRGDQAIQLLLGEFRTNEAARADAELQASALRLLDAGGRTEEATRLRAAFAKGGAPGLAASAPSRPVTAGDSVEGAAAVAPTHEAYAYLKAIPIFAELSLPDLRDLYRLAREARHAPAGKLISEGAAAPGLWVILSGQADVVVGGKVVNTLGVGAYAGEISLVRDAPTSATVAARGEVRALLVPKQPFEHYLFEHPTAAIAIYRLFAQNLADRVRALSAR
jgi:tetratricopeptide (TPR) repeat protein